MAEQGWLAGPHKRTAATSLNTALATDTLLHKRVQSPQSVQSPQNVRNML